MDIKLYSNSNYSVQCTLDSAQYRLSFRWIENELAWYMDLDGLTDTTIAAHSIRLVGGIDLLEPYAFVDLDELWLVDMSGANGDPTFDNFETDFVLYYNDATL
jgi:hypothetical protein